MHECLWQVTLWHRFLYHRWQVPTFSLSSHDPVTLMTQTVTLHVLLITTANTNINHNLIFPTAQCHCIFYFWTISRRNYFWFSQVNLMTAHNVSHLQFWLWFVPIQTMAGASSGGSLWVWEWMYGWTCVQVLVLVLTTGGGLYLPNQQYHCHLSPAQQDRL